jgi:catechol 2,3-dioxygenase-like lactoylglutathione lyase family enzyme
MTRKAIFCVLVTIASSSWAQTSEPDTAVEGQPFFWALSVSDVERSADWYGRVLGFVETRAIETPERGARIRLMRTDSAFLELVEHGAARDLTELDPELTRRYLIHGTFKVGLLVDDLDSTVARLGDLGVPLRGMVFEEPDGSFRSTQIEDPDGNILQLFERLDRNGADQRKSTTTGK